MTTYNANAILLLDKIIQSCQEIKNNIRAQSYENAMITADTTSALLKNVKGYLNIYNIVVPNSWKRNMLNPKQKTDDTTNSNQ